MQSLEEKIGYKFRNSLLLGEALTHPSLAYETQRPHFDNQRLEFLGDAVIQLLLTELLFSLFPSFSEGKLTKLRSRLVSRKALRAYATRIQLGSYLLMGQGEEASGGRERTSTLADAFEALLGAIYLDGGYSAARSFLLSQCESAIQEVQDCPEEINPKGDLQEILQAITTSSPRYHITFEGGPDHCRVFEASVTWQGLELGMGRGHSKKEAEANAAAEALQARRWEQLPSEAKAPATTCEKPANVSE